MKRLVIPGLALVALVCVAVAVAGTKDEAEAGKIEWKTMPQALEEAPRADKKIVLDIYTDWCGWCKRMDRDTYADSGVVEFMNRHFVASKMNPEKEGKVTYQGKEFTQREFSQALGVRGYPATAFFNEQGELLTMVPGYIRADEFKQVLRYFAEDAHLKQSYDEYKKNMP